MPILHGEELVGRLDPQFDRQLNKLIVHAFYVEPGQDSRAIAAAVRPELDRLRGYLEAETIEVGDTVRPVVRKEWV
jgi:uncharacterized protein YcaQ